MKPTLQFPRVACFWALLTLWIPRTQAQLTWTTHNGTIEITGGCPSSPGAVVIPEAIDGLPVTSIGGSAFSACTNLTQITIPNTVTNIGPSAFYWCIGLTNLVIPEGVISIGSSAFMSCNRLLSVVIPATVTTIGPSAFLACSRLDGVVIPDSVTSIGSYGFASCTSLSKLQLSRSQKDIAPATFANCSSLTTVTIPASVSSIRKAAALHDSTPGAFSGCPLRSVYFEGNKPTLIGSPGVFTSTSMTVFFLAGATGWGTTFSGSPTAAWVLPEPVMLKTPGSVALQTNGFGFRISWATNSPVVVEATPSLSAPEWSPVGTNVLVDGWVDFRDPAWADRDQRFYRVRGP